MSGRVKAGSGDTRAMARDSGKPAAAREAEQHGFCLVVEGMRGDDAARTGRRAAASSRR